MYHNMILEEKKQSLQNRDYNTTQNKGC